MSLLFICFPEVPAPGARVIPDPALCGAASCRCISQYADDKRSMLSKMRAIAGARLRHCESAGEPDLNGCFISSAY
ncbi:protein of unknown function [Cupriavidus taiwanensis]|nr:protein of unknown function [Cupriavidus taiwanensis]